MILVYVLSFILYVTDVCDSLASNQKLKVHYLSPGEIINFMPDEKRRGFYESDVRIYCYEGSERILANYFQSIHFQIDIENIDDFTQYEGGTPEIVKEHYEEQKSLFSFNFFTFKKTKIRLDPFNQTCIGIETLQSYKIRLNLIRLDVWKLLIFCVSLVVFTYSAKLSQNAVFYYIAGVSLGICASFLILLYLAGKLIPRRSMMIGVLAGGSTLAIYIIRLLWENIQLIIVSYRDYVIGYVLITGFVSFVICYRFGPPKNKRSKDLIEWCLQVISLASIYFSSYYTKASIEMIVLLIILYYFPRAWIKKVKNIYIQWFPPQRKYITLAEYKEQGIKETKIALNELRKFCSSPECKQWKVMTKLKNPKRFASFIEGEEHLMDEEIFDHDSAKFETDSEDSDDNVPGKKTSDDISENEDISDDEEVYTPSISYRGPSPRAVYSNGSRNHSYNRINSSFMQTNINSSNYEKYSYDSPCTARKTISTSLSSPYSRRMTANNLRQTPNNLRYQYMSHEYDGSDS